MASMKIIDARSGQEMHIGQTITYPGGESVTLLEVRPGNTVGHRACSDGVSGLVPGGWAARRA